MRVTMSVITAVILASTSLFAQLPVQNETANLSNHYTPALQAFGGNTVTWQWSLKNGTSPVDLTTLTPIMWYAKDPLSVGTVTATCAIVGAPTAGIFNATFNASDMPQTNQVYVYSVGVSDGGILNFSQSSLTMKPDPYAAGGASLNTNVAINWAALTWIGLPATITSGALEVDLVAETNRAHIAEGLLNTSITAEVARAETTETVLSNATVAIGVIATNGQSKALLALAGLIVETNRAQIAEAALATSIGLETLDVVSGRGAVTAHALLTGNLTVSNTSNVATLILEGKLNGGGVARTITSTPSGMVLNGLLNLDASGGSVLGGGNTLQCLAGFIGDGSQLTGITPASLTASVTNAFNGRYLGTNATAKSSLYASVANLATNATTASKATYATTAGSASNTPYASYANIATNALTALYASVANSATDSYSAFQLDDGGGKLFSFNNTAVAWGPSGINLQCGTLLQPDSVGYAGLTYQPAFGPNGQWTFCKPITGPWEDVRAGSYYGNGSHLTNILRSASADVAVMATNANSASYASVANIATNANSASYASIANTATNALKLGGIMAASYLTSESEWEAVSNTVVTHVTSAHSVTAGGGFKAGNGATLTVTASGGAMGKNATSQSGGSVGYGASSGAGGAVGQFAIETVGGGAVGISAITTSGGAVGNRSHSEGGFAAGYGALTSAGAAIGDLAKCTTDGTNGIDAIQLGTGVNPSPRTLQVYSTMILSNSVIFPGALATNIPQHGMTLHYSTNNVPHMYWSF